MARHARVRIQVSGRTLLGKTCPDCGEFKQATDFYPRTGGKPGYHTLCKSCNAKRTNAGTRKHQETARKNAVKGYTRWSKEDSRAAHILWDAGVRVEEIAKTLGRSVYSIYNHIELTS